MFCLEAREMFSPKLDSKLSSFEEERLLEHLECCQECSSEWQEWKKLFAALNIMGTQELTAPSGFAATVTARIRQEQTRPRATQNHWKQVIIGTAAALLLAGGSMVLNPVPVINIADQPPTIQDNISGHSTDGQNLDQKQDDLGQTPTVESSDQAPAQITETANRKNANQAGTAQFTNTTNHIILSTFLKIKVDSIQGAEQSALNMARSLGASVQSLGQQSEGGKFYLVDKIIINNSQAPDLLNGLEGLGAVVSRQDQKEDLNSRYAQLYDLLLSLEGQRSTELDKGKIDTLDHQIEQIKMQLQSWDKRSGEQTIVLWIQQ